MSEELFTVPEQLSPRLKWLIYHGIRCYKSDVADVDEPWLAGNGTQTATGQTENDAIIALAQKLGLKLWNEQ